MTNESASMFDLLKLADQASTKSDRWLFVALLIVFIVGAVMAARWMASQNARAFSLWREDMKVMQGEIATLNAERVKLSERFADELRTIIHQQSEDAKAMLRAHSEVLVRNGEVMGLVNAALREMQSSFTIARAGWPFARHVAAPPDSVSPSPTGG